MAARVKAAATGRLIAIGLLGAALAACGGGGGESNRPPTAAFTATPASGPTPLIVTFDASASTDKEGPIASYAWTSGDGASLSGVTATHTYPRPGSFTVTLTVADKKGVTATASQSLPWRTGRRWRRSRRRRRLGQQY
jgi:PKD repeat protein